LRSLAEPTVVLMADPRIFRASVSPIAGEIKHRRHPAASSSAHSCKRKGVKLDRTATITFANVQPSGGRIYPNSEWLRYHGRGHAFAGLPSYMLEARKYVRSKKGSTLESGMKRLTNLGNRWRRSCSGVLVLLAVFSLAVSVATRYCSPQSSAKYSTSTVHKHASPEPARQRMTKGASNWMPSVARSYALQAPTPYPRIAPAGPPIPGVLLEKSLYNRPPPPAEFFLCC
jgi:hypothetical protein